VSIVVGSFLSSGSAGRSAGRSGRNDVVCCSLWSFLTGKSAGLSEKPGAKESGRKGVPAKNGSSVLLDGAGRARWALTSKARGAQVAAGGKSDPVERVTARVLM